MISVVVCICQSYTTVACVRTMGSKGEGSKRKAKSGDGGTPGSREVKRKATLSLGNEGFDWEGPLDVRLFSPPRDGIRVREYMAEYAAQIAENYVVGSMRRTRFGNP